MMKDGSALERLAAIDRAVFDKTGTLTTGDAARDRRQPRRRTIARRPLALARQSAHPVARAVAAHLDAAAGVAAEVREVPGHGVEGRVGGRRARLGRADWVAEIASEGGGRPRPGLRLRGRAGRGSRPLRDAARPVRARRCRRCGAGGSTARSCPATRPGRSARSRSELGIASFRHGARPAEKIAHLEGLRAAGHRVLMVGDGLNDAAALAAAHVSMAPASAADAGRAAADFVFTRERLDAVVTAHAIARRAARLVRQNFVAGGPYNCAAIPLAVAGLVTPLIAALAMSASSILVVANALRLNGQPASPRGAAAELREAPA